MYTNLNIFGALSCITQKHTQAILEIGCSFLEIIDHQGLEMYIDNWNLPYKQSKSTTK